MSGCHRLPLVFVGAGVDESGPLPGGSEVHQCYVDHGVFLHPAQVDVEAGVQRPVPPRQHEINLHSVPARYWLPSSVGASPTAPPEPAVT